MVGGFSESPITLDVVKNAFPTKRVIVPEEAGLAVLKGAVLFGHQSNSVLEFIPPPGLLWGVISFQQGRLQIRQRCCVMWCFISPFINIMSMFFSLQKRKKVKSRCIRSPWDYWLSCQIHIYSISNSIIVHIYLLHNHEIYLRIQLIIIRKTLVNSTIYR